MKQIVVIFRWTSVCNIAVTSLRVLKKLCLINTSERNSHNDKSGNTFYGE